MTTIAKDQILRRCRFTPYRKGAGPTFTLVTWDTYQTALGNKSRLGYRLSMTAPGKRSVVLFEGTDFGCSPCYGVDSDRCIASIMGFLTLRPGDTDSEYFADYTDEQRAYCSEHAEALACEVMDRFPE